MKEFLKIICGNIFITSAYAFITVPHHIVNGGVTSCSMILHNFIRCDISVITNAITLLLLLISFIQLGKSFLMKSLLSSLCYMLFFTTFHALGIKLSIPIFLAVPLAATMVGFGYFLCISSNSSTVGFDVLAIILHKYNPACKIAITMRYINISIVLLGFASYGAYSILIGIIFTLLQTQVLHTLLNRNEKKIQDTQNEKETVSKCIMENGG
ncbi:YitT family protein [[Clostridium] innocuum]|nr:YitT family protein [[Clostridium] innocuum]